MKFTFSDSEIERLAKIGFEAWGQTTLPLTTWETDKIHKPRWVNGVKAIFDNLAPVPTVVTHDELAEAYWHQMNPKAPQPLSAQPEHIRATWRASVAWVVKFLNEKALTAPKPAPAIDVESIAFQEAKMLRMVLARGNPDEYLSMVRAIRERREGEVEQMRNTPAVTIKGEDYPTLTFGPENIQILEARRLEISPEVRVELLKAALNYAANRGDLISLENAADNVDEFLKTPAGQKFYV